MGLTEWERSLEKSDRFLVFFFPEEESLSQPSKGKRGSELSEMHTDPQGLVGQVSSGTLVSGRNSDYT